MPQHVDRNRQQEPSKNPYSAAGSQAAQFSFDDLRPQALVQRQLQEIADRYVQAKNSQRMQAISGNALPIQRLELELPVPGNPGATWKVDTRGRGKEQLFQWIDAQLKANNTGPVHFLKQQLETIPAQERDGFENQVLGFLGSIPAIAAPPVAQAQAPPMVIIADPQDHVQQLAPPTFAEAYAATVPTWEILQPHGAAPKENHSFLFRFTDYTQKKWQKSHLGKDMEEEGIESLGSESKFRTSTYHKRGTPEYETAKKRRAILAAMRRKNEIEEGLRDPRFGLREKQLLSEKKQKITEYQPQKQKLLRVTSDLEAELSAAIARHEGTYGELGSTDFFGLGSLFEALKHQLKKDHPHSATMKEIADLDKEIRALRKNIGSQTAGILDRGESVPGSQDEQVYLDKTARRSQLPPNTLGLTREREAGVNQNAQVVSLEALVNVARRHNQAANQLQEVSKDLAFYENMPDSVKEIRAYLAKYKMLEWAFEHFKGETDQSAFASTTADFWLTARQKDKVMQGVIRSDANLEPDEGYDPAETGRVEGKQQARHLVKYEVPNEILIRPEDVEQVLGLGSSESEGLVAMRAIQERLVFGDNLDDYAVAWAPNPY